MHTFIIIIYIYIIFVCVEFDDLRAKKKKERASIVIWRRPITTLIYFIRELLLEIQRLLYGFVYCVSVIH